jgi:hypothetical protein
MKQGLLFTDDDVQSEPQAPAAPLFIPHTEDDGTDWGNFDSCLTNFGTNHCTLNGETDLLPMGCSGHGDARRRRLHPRGRQHRRVMP